MDQTTCPLCGYQTDVSSRGNLKDHGPGRVANGPGLCAAAGRTLKVASRMLRNRQAGRHIKRNEDGSWLA